MRLTLYSHPFSSYCQKVLIALWENDTLFSYRHLDAPGAADERAALWPLGRFPVLVDEGRTIVESSIIIEHLDLRHAGQARFLIAISYVLSADVETSRFGHYRPVLASRRIAQSRLAECPLWTFGRRRVY